MSSQTQILCPNCNFPIDVQNILAHQLEEDIRQKYQLQLQNEKRQFDQERETLAKAREEFEQKKKQENELFYERLNAKLREEKKVQEESIRKKLMEEQSEQFQSLQTELNQKSEQVKELNRTKADLERLKREKEELKEAAEAEAQKKLNELLTAEKEKIRKMEEEKNELKFREMQKMLDDQKRLTEEMKRKQEQGSMQLQGEVQELAIEEWLSARFPLDNIEEVKKGQRGGDCLQTVNTLNRPDCGKIYYESKRTKEFQQGWIAKFKADMREKGAVAGILVTEALPAGQERMSLVEGVWVCSFEEFKGLSAVIRQSVIEISQALSSQENKGEKMALLYQYLTGPQFRMQVEAIIEGFSSMKMALESEKRAMMRIWKEREKQIEKVMVNTSEMYGSVRGIAGSAIQEVKALDFPDFAELPPSSEE